MQMFEEITLEASLLDLLRGYRAWKAIPLSAVGSFDKYLNFILPKEVEEVAFILPVSLTDRTEEVKLAVLSVRPSVLVSVYFSGKIEKVMVFWK
ncbi:MULTISPECIES: DUF4898 domain-containing protein [Acidianus]|uniref:DUF4898 domain-containing protein n=1 Tax=Candidatus Acidianus copahuensis TaxID=1160895 RepID=A0A031LQR2_9CREN|nr:MULTISPECIES: DUF4898 domain-containing protein [Acidianus]EZQ07100.1 hypothetical protein CM19_05165 [Candidatus Acidianus copahuensis]NON63303.1 DUF4898 domain-containing protein [Acidianus sp. RZ1]